MNVFPEFSSNLLEFLLPDGVISSECLGDFCDLPLVGEEKMVAKDYSAKRLSEFSMGRACARSALSRLGFNNPSIPTGVNREPLWPKGIRGSIAHCEGYVAAAVAFDYQFKAIGIDAEPNSPIESEVHSLIMGKKELSHVGELNDALPNIHWDKLLFSAKESVYKAWFPTHKTWLDFSDCEIAFFLDAQCLGKHPDDLIFGRYCARLIGLKRPFSYDGEWMFVPKRNLLMTAIASPLR